LGFVENKESGGFWFSEDLWRLYMWQAEFVESLFVCTMVVLVDIFNEDGTYTLLR
jgi:hypothetical protein